MGATMAESTRTARNFFTSFGIAGQLPWLDDTGDGLSSALDGQDMGLDRFGRSWAYAGHGTGDVQSFEKVYPPENQTIQFQPGQSVELQVTLVPGSEPEAVGLCSVHLHRNGSPELRFLHRVGPADFLTPILRSTPLERHDRSFY